MASAVDTQKLQSALSVRAYDHDPGATTAIITSPDGGTTKRYVDMKTFTRFMAQAKPTVVGGGGLTKLEIVASAATSFASVVVVKDSGTVAADALDDNVTLECTAEELAQLSSENSVNLRYVAARLTMATNTDEASVTYIAAGGRFSYENLTADSVIT